MATTTRSYVALTLEQAQSLADTRFLGASVSGFGPTPDLDGAELEEAEFASTQLAARAAIKRGMPVLVAALELPLALVQADNDAASASLASDSAGVRPVQVNERVALSRVAALHLADDTLEGVTLQADAAEAIDLSWYDTTEIHHVVQLLTASH
ncbi:hypothetical protein K0651_11400 [Ornithinimicrobium sp. Arc0846-15]|nr:hypothetical protein [Ornithinimicrobium laminariae]